MCVEQPLRRCKTFASATLSTPNKVPAQGGVLAAGDGGASSFINLRKVYPEYPFFYAYIIG